MSQPRVLKSRKILIASIGVATVTYACGPQPVPPTSGNLVPPPKVDSGVVNPPPTSGNLVPPPSLETK